MMRWARAKKQAAGPPSSSLTAASSRMSWPSMKIESVDFTAKVPSPMNIPKPELSGRIRRSWIRWRRRGTKACGEARAAHVPSSRLASRLDEHDDGHGHDHHDGGHRGRIVVGAVVGEELPAGVVYGVDEDRQKQASSAIGVDPAHHHPKQDNRYRLADGRNQMILLLPAAADPPHRDMPQRPEPADDKGGEIPRRHSGREADDGGKRQMKISHDAIGDQRHRGRHEQCKQHPSGAANPAHIANTAPQMKRGMPALLAGGQDGRNRRGHEDDRHRHRPAIERKPPKRGQHAPIKGDGQYLYQGEVEPGLGGAATPPRIYSRDHGEILPEP